MCAFIIRTFFLFSVKITLYEDTSVQCFGIMFIKRHPSANTNSKTQLNQFSTSLERQNSVESVHPSDEDDSEDEFDEDVVADAEGLDGSRNGDFQKHFCSKLLIVLLHITAT